VDFSPRTHGPSSPASRSDARKEDSIWPAPGPQASLRDAEPFPRAKPWTEVHGCLRRVATRRRRCADDSEWGRRQVKRAARDEGATAITPNRTFPDEPREFAPAIPRFGALVLAEGCVLLFHGIRLALPPYPLYGDTAACFVGTTSDKVLRKPL
jgi:hypothetical protein